MKLSLVKPSVIAFLMAACFAAESLAADTAAKLTGDQALQRLVAGNQRFVNDRLEHPNQSIQRRLEIARGQEPFAIILGCTDSRVPPEIIFDLGLGDLFVVRVAGNIVEKAGLGSIEYAVEHLHAPLIVVLGHKQCGAVAVAVSGGHAAGAVAHIIKAIRPAVKESRSLPGDKLANTVRANVARMVKKLREARSLKPSVQADKLKIVGGHYDWDTGRVELLPEK